MPVSEISVSEYVNTSTLVLDVYQPQAIDTIVLNYSQLRGCRTASHFKKIKRSIAVSGNHLTATGNHMPYGICHVRVHCRP